MVEYSDKAVNSLVSVNVADEKKRELERLIKELMYREV